MRALVGSEYIFFSILYIRALLNGSKKNTLLRCFMYIEEGNIPILCHHERDPRNNPTPAALEIRAARKTHSDA